MPFDEEDEVNVKTKGLKVSNTNSSVHSKVVEKQSFDKKADEAFEKDQDYKHSVWEFSSQFVKIINDQTLDINKTPLVKNVETDLINKLIDLSYKINADENQPEGAGSIVLSTLLLKTVLLQRDKINKLSFDLLTLKKQLDDFQKNNSK